MRKSFSFSHCVCCVYVTFLYFSNNRRSAFSVKGTILHMSVRISCSSQRFWKLKFRAYTTSIIHHIVSCSITIHHTHTRKKNLHLLLLTIYLSAFWPFYFTLSLHAVCMCCLEITQNKIKYLKRKFLGVRNDARQPPILVYSRSHAHTVAFRTKRFCLIITFYVCVKRKWTMRAYCICWIPWMSLFCSSLNRLWFRVCKTPRIASFFSASENYCIIRV